MADVDSSDPRIISARSIGTRIGEGLKESGRLGELPMQRTLDAISELYADMAVQAELVAVIATSALRRAENADVFAARVRAVTGLLVSVVSGAEEARYSFLGAVQALPGTGWFGVADVGGGSTEYAIGVRGDVRQTVSCETGAVRLTESFPERGAERARSLLAPIAAFRKVDRLAFVGGSATTAASILRGNRDPFTIFELTGSDLRALLATIASMSVEARKLVPGMSPQRADILPAGLAVLNAILELTGHESATVTTSDLLFGYLLDHFP